MDGYPLSVSIIIPTYNRADIIDRAINSLLNQTYQDFELIIVDDGSTDNTEEKLLAMKDRDMRIKYFRNKDNRGPAAARNTGIKMASGRYIAFQDSDDEWMPEKLERQINVFHKASDDVGVVYTGFYRVFADKKVYYPSEKLKKKEGDIHYELLSGNFIGASTVLIKRECFEAAGLFDEFCTALEDWELFIRLSRKFKFLLIDAPLVIVYESPDSISKSQSRLIKSLQWILQKHYNDFIKNPKILATYYFQIGDYLAKNGNFDEAKTYIRQAFHLRPLRSKPFLTFILSLLGEKVYKKLL